MVGETAATQNKAPFSFFICVYLSLFLAIFYNTVTNMAGIYIASDLGGSVETSVYPMVFFGLGNVLSLPLANPLADRLGSVKLLVYGLLIYTFFSVLCSIAPTFFLFNVFRLGLGLSSGIFYILCRNLIIEFTSPKNREAYAFIMLLLYVLLPVFGACFGAWLAYESHWRWIFHFNEPISLFLAAYFWFFYRHSDSPKQSAAFDKVGYIFFVIGIGTLVTALTLSQELDWYRSPTLRILTVIGLPSLLFFILWEINHPEPLLEIRLLRSPILAYALLNLALLFSAYFGMIILITLWLNIYVDYTPHWVSLLIATMAFAGILAYFGSKYLLHKLDPRSHLAVAILFFAISCYYSTYFDVDVDFYHLAVARFLAGLGLILFVIPVFRLSMASHGSEKSSSIFTLFQIVRATFSSLGAGLYVILWHRRQVFFHDRLGENLTVYSKLTSSYFDRAIDRFHLTKEQSTEQLDVYLNRQATSLALNDVFGFMGYILIGLLVLLALTYVIEKITAKKITA